MKARDAGPAAGVPGRRRRRGARATARPGSGAARAGGVHRKQFAAVACTRLPASPRPLARARSAPPPPRPQSHPGPTHLHAWDVDYYTSRARAAAAGRLRPDAAAPYLQLDSVLDGLSALLARSIGVELRREQLSIGSVPGGLAGWEGEGGPSSRGGRDPAADGAEAWAPGVRRLGVWDARGGGRLGTLYLDMHARPGKLPGSVLFPIRCGRRLPGAPGRAGSVVGRIEGHRGVSRAQHDASPSGRRACLLGRQPAFSPGSSISPRGRARLLPLNPTPIRQTAPTSSPSSRW